VPDDETIEEPFTIGDETDLTIVSDLDVGDESATIVTSAAPELDVPWGDIAVVTSVAGSTRALGA
jgi:hypothetical protein